MADGSPQSGWRLCGTMWDAAAAQQPSMGACSGELAGADGGAAAFLAGGWSTLGAMGVSACEAVRAVPLLCACPLGLESQTSICTPMHAFIISTPMLCSSTFVPTLVSSKMHQLISRHAQLGDVAELEALPAPGERLLEDDDHIAMVEADARDAAAAFEAPAALQVVPLPEADCGHGCGPA